VGLDKLAAVHGSHRPPELHLAVVGQARVGQHGFRLDAAASHRQGSAFHGPEGRVGRLGIAVRLDPLDRAERVRRHQMGEIEPGVVEPDRGALLGRRLGERQVQLVAVLHQVRLAAARPGREVEQRLVAAEPRAGGRGRARAEDRIAAR